VRSSGVVPVVAHPERYAGCTTADVLAWRAAGAAVQGHRRRPRLGRRPRTALRRLLAAGALDVLASDNQRRRARPRRRRELLAAPRRRRGGGALTVENPARLLSAPAPSRPAVVLRVGLLARLARYVAPAARPPHRAAPRS
jgi:protein-tyrosine phosphatase